MVGIYNELVFTEALAQVGALTSSTDADEISTRIEQIVCQEDLAMVCLMVLVMKARGVDTDSMNGIELANCQPTIMDLILPAGFDRGG